MTYLRMANKLSVSSHLLYILLFTGKSGRRSIHYACLYRIQAGVPRRSGDGAEGASVTT